MGEAVTQLRKFRDAVSNYFDEIERGIGKRGSTFTDVDAVSHDKDTGRFLFREFKIDGEPLTRAQRWTLSELATLPRCTVWFVRRRDDGRIGWALFGSGRQEIVISVEEYRARLQCWWNSRAYIEPVAVVLAPDVEDLDDATLITADDINWGGVKR